MLILGEVWKASIGRIQIVLPVSNKKEDESPHPCMHASMLVGISGDAASLAPCPSFIFCELVSTDTDEVNTLSVESRKIRQVNSLLLVFTV